MVSMCESHLLKSIMNFNGAKNNLENVRVNLKMALLKCQ